MREKYREMFSISKMPNESLDLLRRAWKDIENN
jgi:hypothetical protein